MQWRRRFRSRVPMRFWGWDPGTKRVGIANEIPNLHQDYNISNQDCMGFRGILKRLGLIGARIYYDLRSTQIHGISGFQVAMAWIIKVRTIFLLLNKRFGWIYLAFHRRIQRFARSGSGKFEDCIKRMTGIFGEKRLVQGFVSPRKRTSATAGIRQGEGVTKVEEKGPQTFT